MGRPRRDALSRRAGTGRQCTGRGFSLDLMPLPSAPPSADRTPMLQLAIGAAPSTGAATSGPRSGSFCTPMEGVPERLFFKTPGVPSRLGRTPGPTPASPADTVDMTPMEGVPERAIRRPPSTVRKPGRLPAAFGSFPRLQRGQNTAPTPGLTPAALPCPAFGANPAPSSAASPADADARSAEVRREPSQPAQLRTESGDESDGDHDHSFNGGGGDSCGEGVLSNPRLPVHPAFICSDGSRAL